MCAHCTGAGYTAERVGGGEWGWWWTDGGRIELMDRLFEQIGQIVVNDGMSEQGRKK